MTDKEREEYEQWLHVLTDMHEQLHKQVLQEREARGLESSRIVRETGHLPCWGVPALPGGEARFWCTFGYQAVHG